MIIEEKSKKVGKIIIGLVIAISSLIGIIFSIFLPLAYNPIQLTLSVLYIIGMLLITKGLINNRSVRLYWLIFLSIGLITLFSFFTPALYNIPGIEVRYDPNWGPNYPNLRDFSWLWDYHIVYSLYDEDLSNIIMRFTPGIFYIFVIPIISMMITIFSFFLRKETNFIKYGGLFRTMANFLIVFSIALFFTNMLFITRAWFNEVTVGFAYIGPFFLGILTKLELRTFQKNLDLTMDDYQRKRYKSGYISSIIGGYLLILFSILVLLLRLALEALMSSQLANLIIDYSRFTYLILASFAFLSIFCALFFPRAGIISLLILGLLVLLFVVLINPFLLYEPTGSLAMTIQFLIVFLISVDLQKTRKIRKLARPE